MGHSGNRRVKKVIFMFTWIHLSGKFWYEICSRESDQKFWSGTFRSISQRLVRITAARFLYIYSRWMGLARLTVWRVQLTWALVRLFWLPLKLRQKTPMDPLFCPTRSWVRPMSNLWRSNMPASNHSVQRVLGGENIREIPHDFWSAEIAHARRH